MLFSILLAVTGFTGGLLCAPVLLPALLARLPALAKFIRQMPPTVAFPSSLRAKIDAAIAESQQQVRDRVDIDRNMTRIAQLRELIGED